MLIEIKQILDVIDTLEDDVREHINTTRYQSYLIKDGNTWNQICCSLDTIGDTAYAIKDYIEADYPELIGLPAQADSLVLIPYSL